LSSDQQVYGYIGKALRADLSKRGCIHEILDEVTFLRKYIGRAILGINFLYDEVNPGIE
jgi:hypothetical protein